MTEVQQAEILETIRLIAPEFSEDEKCTDEFVGKFIKLSAPLVSAERFGEYYIQAMAYLTAHRMKMAGYGDTSLGSLAQTGRLASVTEGGESISFGSTTGSSAGANTDAEYLLTSYGAQFLALRNLAITPIMIRH